jgi:ribonuclease HII
LTAIACIAGPLVAVAVCLDLHDLAAGEAALAELYDSKRLLRSARERLFPLIEAHAARVAVRIVAPAEIDRRGVHVANLEALAEALAEASAGYAEEETSRLVDHYPLGAGAPAHTSITRGDATSAAIAAASVIAKVTRDRLMAEEDRRHPAYGFARHHGYPTAAHARAVVEHGPSPIHRISCRTACYAEHERRRGG